MKRSHAVAAGATLAVGVAAFLTVPAATAAHKAGYEPVLNPADFVKVIDNPYFPLPVGRTLIYRGIKDGRSQIDRVHVTSKTKKIEGKSRGAHHPLQPGPGGASAGIAVAGAIP